VARKKQVAVIGLGRFGASMCFTLMREGCEVLAIDTSEKRVSELSTLATHVVQADSTDERVLDELDIKSFDQVVIAIGEDVQSSILTALMVKQLGVGQVWAKARSDYHAKVLELIGVDRVVHPEREMGERVARLIASDSLIDFLELPGGHRLIEIRTPRSMAGKSLRDLDVRAQFGCIVVGFQRETETTIAPDPDAVISLGDVLFVIGSHADLERLQREADR
jgi:trk system potassium uptake protein TrkA